MNNLAKAQIAVDRLGKKINEQKFSGLLKVTAKVAGNELEISQCMTGSIGNVSVHIDHARRNGVGPYFIEMSGKQGTISRPRKGNKLTGSIANMFWWVKRLDELQHRPKC